MGMKIILSRPYIVASHNKSLFLSHSSSIHLCLATTYYVNANVIYQTMELYKPDQNLCNTIYAMLEIKRLT